MATRIAQILREDLLAVSGSSARLADASTVARVLGVERDWVYAHAQELGAIRLGGPRGRLRFDLADIQNQLGATSEPRPTRPRRHPRRARRQAAGKVELLPYTQRAATFAASGRTARQRSRP